MIARALAGIDEVIHLTARIHAMDETQAQDSEYVSITNLIDLVQVCVVHPQAEELIFLVSDGEAVSASILIRRIAQAYGVKPRLFYCPDAYQILSRRWQSHQRV